ncbi:MAG: membrane protein insertion efficiency factor YidD [Bdellovibrionales bacterium]|nr:membrane protein insertion efficiency factor YidD [Bdellovibrionales bacterium]
MRSAFAVKIFVLKFLDICFFLYRFILSPALHVLTGKQAACRFHPSCSEYARICLKEYPLGLALWFSLKRFLRCNPWCTGGVDYPPPGVGKSSLG